VCYSWLAKLKGWFDNAGHQKLDTDFTYFTKPVLSYLWYGACGVYSMIESSSLFFEYSKVPQGDPLLNEVYRLRYKVYVEECGFENEADHPGGIEKDDFDEHSTHFVVRRKGEDQIIGTIRMIHYSEKGFPIEKHCKIDTDLSAFDRRRFGEISRLAVSKDYRKRVTDTVYSDGKAVEDSDVDNMFSGHRKMSNDIVLGLYKCIYRESLERGNQYIVAVVAKGLYLLMKRVGILFEPIGPEQNYHGLRAPYLGRIDTMLLELARRNPTLYAQFMK
jgi:N-acyl amino acid synthase of PEP-CTERM/exosortase system